MAKGPALAWLEVGLFVFLFARRQKAERARSFLSGRLGVPASLREMTRFISPWQLDRRVSVFVTRPPFFALRETFSRRARASLQDRLPLFPARHYSIARAAALQRAHGCARCRRVFRRLHAAYLRQSKQKVFHKEWPAGSRRHAGSNCICARWPSSKVRARDNKELRPRTQSAGGA